MRYIFQRLYLIFFFGLLASQAVWAQQATIRLDADQRFQKMNGWEVLARGWEYDKSSNRFDGSWYRNSELHGQIMDALVEEAGINRVRIEIRSGMENPKDYWAAFERGEISYDMMKGHFYHKVNDNSDPFSANPAGFHFSFLDFQIENVVKPLMKRLNARGEKLYINLCVVDFKWGGEELSNFSLANNPEEYAELVSQAVYHMQNRYGLLPDALEVMLEPENTNGWRGSHIGRAGVAATNRVYPQRIFPELLLPSVVNAKNAVRYFQSAMSIPGVAPRTAALSYHRYAGRRPAIMGEIRNAALGKGVRVEMLEYTNGKVDDLIQDLTIAQASAWQLYSIIARHPPASPTPARSVLLYGTPEDGNVGLSHQGRELAQYFRYIRRGAQRIGAVTDNANYLGLAFDNPPEGLFPGTVLVIRSKRPGQIEVQNLPEGRYGISYTDLQVISRELPPLIVETDAVQLDVPAHSILSIYPLAAE
jgi:hypothetical protein